MATKKVLLQKSISGTVYDIMPKTDATIVQFTKGEVGSEVTTTVAAELATLALDIAALPTDADLSALRTEIIGELGDNETLAASFDTLKEVAEFLDEHDDSIGALAGLITDVGAASEAAVGEEGEDGYVPAKAATGMHLAVETLQSQVAGLLAANGTNVSKSKSGSPNAGNGELYLDGVLTTVYDDQELVSAIGVEPDSENDVVGSGLRKRVADLEAGEGNVISVTAKQNSDGVLLVNGSDVVAYGGDPTVVTQDTTHRFVTDTEKARWNDAVSVVAALPATPDSNVLYAVELS